jgi:hypothetical protein
MNTLINYVAIQKKTIESVSIEFNSILCIPGHWASDQEAKLALVQATNGKYIAAGGVMINAKKEKHFTFEVCERDERMKQSFAVAGRVTGVTENFLDEIDRHRSVVYISAPIGSLLEAKQIAFAGEAILKAGGIGIKIETAGKAFEKDSWFSLTNNFQEHNLFEMFVIDSLYGEDRTVFSD